MAFEVAPDGSNASTTVSSTASDKPDSARRAAPMRKPSRTIVSPADSKRSDTGKEHQMDSLDPSRRAATCAPATLAAYIIGWGAIGGTH